jgi:hypothetical protein
MSARESWRWLFIFAAAWTADTATSRGATAADERAYRRWEKAAQGDPGAAHAALCGLALFAWLMANVLHRQEAVS